MSTLTFKDGECAILYTNNSHGRHSIEIVQICNGDVWYGADTATIRMGAFATKVPKDNLYKLPSGIKKRIKEQS